MPHKGDCQCVACRYRRGEGKGRAPRLSVRLTANTREWILARPEGAREYIEGLVREQIAEMLRQATETLTNALDAGPLIASPLPGVAQEFDDLRHELEAGHVPDLERLRTVDRRLYETIGRATGVTE